MFVSERAPLRQSSPFGGVILHGVCSCTSCDYGVPRYESNACGGLTTSGHDFGSARRLEITDLNRFCCTRFFLSDVEGIW